ncbi:hypothetical protein NDU88_006344 [Pleurodeles waltl]|uniref:Uncharacterized protein n=1 Tax=Pleurodeles waltl TaxID=8319 RepID=A0AAV7N0K8_PLEWA|nr:hypothetical protein NDU88_006344 [Pleurodeles waltl]
MAATSGDTGVDAASGPPRSRGLGCGAARARERIARGVPGPALYRLGCPGAGVLHCPLVQREGGGPRRRWTTMVPGPENDRDGTAKHRQGSAIARGLNRT